MQKSGQGATGTVAEWGSQGRELVAAGLNPPTFIIFLIIIILLGFIIIIGIIIVIICSWLFNYYYL